MTGVMVMGSKGDGQAADEAFLLVSGCAACAARALDPMAEPAEIGRTLVSVLKKASLAPGHAQAEQIGKLDIGASLRSCSDGVLVTVFAEAHSWSQR